MKDWEGKRKDTRDASAEWFVLVLVLVLGFEFGSDEGGEGGSWFWEMENGKWKVESGKWKVEACPR